jgi:hypothetical protein
MALRHRQQQLPWLASVLVSVPAAAAIAAAAPAAPAAPAAAYTPPSSAAAGCHGLLRDQLRRLHRRSEREKLHSLAQLSVGLWQQPGVLHHAD